jgi:peptidoglycan hydrolase-like protein with peptidoglycan-binding domain
MSDMNPRQTKLYKIQERLKELGIYEGKVDGWDGKQTRSAIKAFQRTHGLLVDGIAGRLTMAEMFPEPIPERDQDIETPHGSQNWPRQKDVEKFFGKPGANQTILDLPEGFKMRLAWDTRKIIKSFSIHEKVHDSAWRCFDRIADAYDEDMRRQIGIDLFGGCLNVRKMRGGNLWSMHAFGAAIDFDPARNQLHWGKDKARLALPDCEKFWRIFEEEGWVSLGRARGYDFMHAQAVRL